MQIASVAGVWGISFILCWTASILALYREGGFRPGRAKTALNICLYCCVAAVFSGGLRTAVFEPHQETVKIAGISVELLKDYWGLILDKKVPGGEAAAYKKEFAGIEEKLFSLSRDAVRGGDWLPYISAVFLIILCCGRIWKYKRQGNFTQLHNLQQDLDQGY